LFSLQKKTLSAKDINELIEWLKTNPNKATAAVSSLGARILAATFRKETGTQFAIVPYRGNAMAVQDLVAGQVDLYFGAPADAMSLVQAGNIKAYGVTSDARIAQAPDIPTFGEMGLPAVYWSAWYGLFAPKDTPREIIGRLNLAAADALADTAVEARLAELGFEIFPREKQTPEAFRALVKADAERWWPLIKEFGIKAQ
jgi:tripartite-type tricarboxylate transporter receptor subunit TctC